MSSKCPIRIEYTTRSIYIYIQIYIYIYIYKYTIHNTHTGNLVFTYYFKICILFMCFYSGNFITKTIVIIKVKDQNAINTSYL